MSDAFSIDLERIAPMRDATQCEFSIDVLAQFHKETDAVINCFLIKMSGEEIKTLKLSVFKSCSLFEIKSGPEISVCPGCRRTGHE